jgi:hypothetical protein
MTEFLPLTEELRGVPLEVGQGANVFGEIHKLSADSNTSGKQKRTATAS